MLPLPAKKYMIAGIAAAPDVLDALLKDISADDPVWDLRPDAERFTIREAIAHLADWEPIWMERLTRIRDEDNPLLPDMDESQFAIDHDYAHQDPRANLRRFHADRAALVTFLSALPDAAWERTGQRPPVINTISMEGFAVLLLGHDGYHAHQIVQWLAAGRQK